MTKYDTNEVRSTVAAALLSIVFSAVLVIGAVGPANIGSPVNTSVAGQIA